MLSSNRYLRAARVASSGMPGSPSLRRAAAVLPADVPAPQHQMLSAM